MQSSRSTCLFIDPISRDLLRQTRRLYLLYKIRQRCYSFIFLSPPCKSLIVAPDGSRPLLRPLSHPWGLVELPTRWKAYLQRRNVLVQFSIDAIKAASFAGTPRALENPASRGVPGFVWTWKRFLGWASLLNLLDAEEVGCSYQGSVKAQDVTFAACSSSVSDQRYTTLPHEPRVLPASHPLGVQVERSRQSFSQRMCTRF